MTSVLADIDVFVESDIEACLRFGKPDKHKSQKTMIYSVNRKNCKKRLFNKKSLLVAVSNFLDQLPKCFPISD